jgi:hypothetical protein
LLIVWSLSKFSNPRSGSSGFCLPACKYNYFANTSASISGEIVSFQMNSEDVFCHLIAISPR